MKFNTDKIHSFKSATEDNVAITNFNIVYFSIIKLFNQSIIRIFLYITYNIFNLLKTTQMSPSDIQDIEISPG